MKNLIILFAALTIPGILIAQNVGVGTNNPTEKLEVNGIIFTSQGGIKFPDGTIQTTAYQQTNNMMPQNLSGLVIEFSGDAGVSGPAQDVMITNGLNVQSVQNGVGVAVSIGGGGGSGLQASNPSLSEITFTRSSDFNSSQLRSLVHRANLPGGVIDYIEVFYLSLINSDYRIEHIERYEQCIISGYSISSGGSQPTEAISFSFVKGCYRSYEYAQDGSVQNIVDRCFDRVQNTDQCGCSF